MPYQLPIEISGSHHRNALSTANQIRRIPLATTTTIRFVVVVNLLSEEDNELKFNPSSFVCGLSIFGMPIHHNVNCDELSCSSSVRNTTHKHPCHSFWGIEKRTKTESMDWLNNTLFLIIVSLSIKTNSMAMSSFNGWMDSWYIDHDLG